MTEKSQAILDAGPSITFCAVSRHSMLYEVLGQKSDLLAPDVVSDEVTRKGGKDFKAVKGNWQTLTENGHIKILDSTAGVPSSADLEREVKRIERMSLAERSTQAKNLGELLAICHAIVLRNQGKKVAVLMDDREGQIIAARNKIQVISTERVLGWSAQSGHIKDKGEMRSLYARMRPLDLALRPLEQTELLSNTLWNPIKAAARAAQDEEASVPS